MATPVFLVVVLPIVCAIFGFAFGVTAARWRSYLGKHDTYSRPSVTNQSCLEEITIQTSSSLFLVERAGCIPTSSCQQLTSTSSKEDYLEEQFNVGLPPLGLAQIRTPTTHRSREVFLDEATTPVNNKNLTTPVNTGLGAAGATGGVAGGVAGLYSRPRSPTAHLMGHLVRCASQAIDQMESRSVLHRLTSADAATPFFAPPPMPSGFLFSPVPGAGDDENTNNVFVTGGSGSDEIHMDEVDLISKLGGGSFGSVYRGAWRGAPVAIKYIRTRTDKADSLGSAIREVVLSKKLTHPNIVQTFSWTVLAQPCGGEVGNVKKENDNACGAIHGGSLLDFGRNESDVSEIARLSSSPSVHHRTASVEEERTRQQQEKDELEGYFIPAVWNNITSTKSTTNSNSFSQRQKQQLKMTVTATEATTEAPVVAQSSSAPVVVVQSSSALARGVKRRRTGLDSATPSPTSLGLDPRMDSFNSEEGFGSPVKKKHGGVQSIFNLESLQLTETEALLVVVMEHCDLGSLQRALSRRAFLPSAKWPQHAVFRALLRTAAEISKGMEYIHGQHGVVHGDLKPANVLLKTHRADRRGYVAKVADFGLSWHVEEEEEEEQTTSETTSHRNNNITNAAASVGGTTAYLPPEAFEGSSSSRGRPGDVYAFGVMLWSMYYCKSPYEGMMEAQVCAGVLGGWLRPEFTDDCPAAFRSLAERCWAQSPADRPTFAQVWRELVNIEVDFRSQRLRSKSDKMAENDKRPASATAAVCV